MGDEHEHQFHAKYKREDGRIVIANPCVCAHCDQLAFIEIYGYKVVVSLVPLGTEVRYSITLEEDKA